PPMPHLKCHSSVRSVLVFRLFVVVFVFFFFFSSRRRHTRSKRDWSSDVCSSDLSAKDPLRSCRETDNAAAPPPRSSVRNHQGTRAARCDRYCGCDGSVPAATARRSRTCNQVLVQVDRKSVV